MGRQESHYFNVRDALRARQELATIHRDPGALEVVMSMQSEVVVQSEIRLGMESLDTLHEKSCLARILSKKKMFGEAVVLEEHVLEVYRNRYATRREIFEKMRNLALTLYDLDRFDDAAELQWEAMRGVKQLYREDHIETATAMFNLGATYLKFDRVRESLSLLSNLWQSEAKP
jgi:tetratricopeptide (TPR) repeat protein